MTTKLEQAAQQALEDICAAKLCEINSMSSRHEMLRLMDKAITALREALADPVRKCNGLLCNDCGEYKQRYKDLPGLTEKDLCVCALAEQAEQEPVAIDWEHLQNFWRNNSSIDWGELESAVKCAVAAPVSIAKQSETDSSSSSMRTTGRTKDLTDDEIVYLWNMATSDFDFARAVITADREKNNANNNT